MIAMKPFTSTLLLLTLTVATVVAKTWKEAPTDEANRRSNRIKNIRRSQNGVAVAITHQRQLLNNGDDDDDDNSSNTGDSHDSEDDDDDTSKEVAYEIWASDQSNSVAGQEGLGLKGSFLWIFGSDAVTGQLDNDVDAVPLPCTPGATKGPCDILDMFPGDLIDQSGNTLSALGKFGRLHGVIKDPFNKYVNANFFVPGGGYCGIIDTETKEAIALFRVTKFSGATGDMRSVHMSFWSTDGASLIFANLHGKAIERVNVGRDPFGTITSLVFDKSATLGLGKGMEVLEDATFFTGNNAFGNPLIGGITGAYSNADLGDFTPNNRCKEDGCSADDKDNTGRLNNVPICPIPSTSDNLYITLGGGGLLVADLKLTPMAIVGEYTSNVVNGAGCGGVQTGSQIFLNAGVSAGGSGFDQSTFTVYAFDDTAFGISNKQNKPMPVRVYKDPTNTATIGNVESGITNNISGQIPGQTTRRDSHGAAVVTAGNGIQKNSYVHIVDRIQNVVEVFHATTYDRTTYDLVSKDAMSGRSGVTGPCWRRSVTDDHTFPLNDPSPDLMEITPDGKYLAIAFRGPAPVSVRHSAQGSCPGIGIVEITASGSLGRLVDVVRTTNTIDDAPFEVAGGVDYAGAERSDVHGVIVVFK